MTEHELSCIVFVLAVVLSLPRYHTFLYQSNTVAQSTRFYLHLVHGGLLHMVMCIGYAESAVYMSRASLIS